MFVKYYFTFIVNFFMKASIRRSVPKRKKNKHPPKAGACKYRISAC